MSVEGRLVHLCTIRTVVSTLNDAGEEVAGTPVDVTNVPCLFGQGKAGRILALTGEWVSRNPSVILPGWVTVAPGNIVIGTYAPGYATSFKVLTVEPSGFNEITHYVAEIKAVS